MDVSSVNDSEVQACKVEGCTNPIAARLGPYGGLCTEHADEKKAERKAPVEVVEQPARSNGTAPLPRELRHLLLDLVLVDTLDLDQVRLDAARILLAQEKP